MKTRRPAVDGQFYPASKAEINRLINLLLLSEENNIELSYSEKKIIGGIVPHAGYIYSGYQAVHFFRILQNSTQKFDTVFIINPNHLGFGPDIALDENDYWKTPIGVVKIDKDFCDYLTFEKSSAAHKNEHSGEVMLPFLQYFLDYEFKILPITISKQSRENARNIAEQIFSANKKLNKKILLIASSDFSHFLSPQKGREMDEFVVKEILDLNSLGVEKQVREKNISVCGYGPIMALIEYSLLVSENPKIKILKRGHSGQVSPSNSVVDYISMLFYQD